MNKRMLRLGHQERSLLSYIAKNPGTNSLQARKNSVHYAKGWSNRASDAVLGRLRRKNFVASVTSQGPLSLYVTNAGLSAIES